MTEKAPEHLRLELSEGSSPAQMIDPAALISVVVPLYNEQATVAALYAEVSEALADLAWNWEIVYVDDGSTDGSHAELVRLHAEHDNVRVVRLRRNFGTAVAL